MRKSLLLSLALLFMASMAFAQDRTVSGKVTSAEDGSALPGVNIVVKGTTTGAVTDIDGNYKLSVPEGGVIVFSFIGLETQEIVVGNRSVIDVTMVSDAEQLSEVVVTAIGIEQEKVAVGYGVTSLSTESIEGRQESDIARILRGKATGVDITQTSGLAGSGTNVIIRGYSSISGTNQPLFVVDGIPFNTNTNDGDQDFISGNATASSRFLDLDPNNIADITILKGLSATVLYGENGRNGVVLVTTKTGQGGSDAGKKMEITFTQGVHRSEVANLPDYQNSFGNGFNAGFGWYYSNWGAAFDDLNPSSYGSDFKGLTPDGKQVIITHPYDQSQYHADYPEYIGAEYIYQPYESVENFVQPGFAANTSINVAGALGENASFSASYAFLTDEGFTPRLDEMRDNERSNYLDKHNFGLGVKGQLKNGLKVQGSFNYVTSKKRAPITGPAFGGDGSGVFAALLFTPRSIDLMGLPYQSPIDGRNTYYRRGGAIQNPRWILNNGGQKEDLSRFFSSTSLSYDINDNISLLYRLSLDNYTQYNLRYFNKGGAPASDEPDGAMSSYTMRSNTVDHIANVMFNFDLNESLSLNGVAGFNARMEDYSEIGLLSTQQFVFNLVDHDNYINHDSYSYIRSETTLGAFVTATLGFNDYLYLNLQGRNDWTSTLEKENRSIFYPSASVSFLATEAIDALNNDILNYLKLRVGYGTSAGYPNPYTTGQYLSSGTKIWKTPGGTDLNYNSVSNRLGNPNLKPELHEEIEAGIEAKLLNGIVGIDASLYQKNSDDLIIDLDLDPATGYTTTNVNAASIENKGIELGLNISPLRDEFKWDMTFNFTKNVNTVNEIYEGVDQVWVAGYTNLGNVAVPGEPMGALYGSTFIKDPDGNYVVNSIGEHQESGTDAIIGDPNPNYTLVWINSLSWKGFSFGFQWHYTDGGDIYSSTVTAMLARGNTTDTDVDRNVPLIMPNSVKQVGTDGDGNAIYEPNDIQTYIGDSFFTAYFFAHEGGVFDATVLRLREVSLSYAIPKSLLEKTPFGSAAITIAGENLWYNAPNFPVGINFDPEQSSLGVGNGRGFDFRTAPTAKKYGATLTLTF